MLKRYEVCKEEQKWNQIKKMYERVCDCADSMERRKIVEELVKMQNQDGSWSVIDTVSIDSDIRIHYFYEPTYYATAAIMKADLCEYYAQDSEEKVALYRGLVIAAGRGLNGHGYDATASLLETLGIYKRAGVYEWMKRNKGKCDTFEKMLINIVNHFRSSIKQGTTFSDWNKDFRSEFKIEIEEYENCMVSHVWYAAYGSNINRSRFMEYIYSCTNKTEPLEQRPYIIPHNVYFAYKSRRWNRKGVAFLDQQEDGMSLGCIYKISMEQFGEIQRMEGAIYGKKIYLGDYDGLPVYTFTASAKRTDFTDPSIQYAEVIMTGLKELYPSRSVRALELYLYSKIICHVEEMRVLEYLRNAPHGVTIEALEDCGVSAINLRRVIGKLYYYNFIKQDSRNVATGVDKLSKEAVIYSCKEKRELIDILLLKWFTV